MWLYTHLGLDLLLPLNGAFFICLSFGRYLYNKWLVLKTGCLIWLLIESSNSPEHANNP